MDVRKSEGVRIIRADAAQPKAKQNRTRRFVALSVGASAASGLAAVLGIGPFAALHASANIGNTHPPGRPIEARTLFPAVQPLHKVVDVNDPPQAPRPPAVAPRPVDDNSSSWVHSTPSSSVEPGDDSGDD